MTSITKTLEEVLGPDTNRNLNEEMMAATSKNLCATSTTETSLWQHEYDDDDEDVVTPRTEPKQAKTTMSVLHKKAHSGKKPTKGKLKTMSELDKEAKKAAAKKEYESYGVGKSANISEQCRSEEQQKAYFEDLDEEEDESIDQERYAKQLH